MQFESTTRSTPESSQGFDESMSVYCPMTTKFGNLPHLSQIQRKPEPLGIQGDKLYKNWNGFVFRYSMRQSWNGKPRVCQHDKETAACCARMAVSLRHTWETHGLDLLMQSLS